MNSSVIDKLKKVSAFILFIVIVISVSYLAVYKASFLPNGYEIVSQQKDRVTVQSFNLIGMEKDKTTVVFSEDDVWKNEYLSDQIERQKSFLWMLFTASSISIRMLIIKLREGMKWWRAIWESNLIIALFIPLISINSSLTTVQALIGKL
ncbi:hypothetical protein [Sporosarcina sp. YIM B06819]|uniref:hypothetical protein n=1 Tax=Sporosarcina sp. YIM B06819 TaxID=3081769 RepID=UPI00298CAED3|nr:hypothetical protein [Sporosarcina sp. YIM B06819]